MVPQAKHRGREALQRDRDSFPRLAIPVLADQLQLTFHSSHFEAFAQYDDFNNLREQQRLLDSLRPAK